MQFLRRKTSATTLFGLFIFASIFVQDSSAFGGVSLRSPSSKSGNAALFPFPATGSRTLKSITRSKRTGNSLKNRPRTSKKQTKTTTALACQLLGMNCKTPTDFSFSFKGFCRRGGETDVHADGWGLAVYEDSGLRQFHDVQAASESPMAKFLSNYPIRTLNMMGHIRYATVGHVNLSNVHPFSREMWGIQWCFSHNGEVPMFKQEPDSSSTSTIVFVNGATNGAVQQQPSIPKKQIRLTSLGASSDGCEEAEYYHPIGSTDSEAIFCAMLNALRARFQTLPSLPALYDALQKLSNEAVAYDPDGTILNYLLSCGPHTLWAYSCPGSRPGSKVWNGLYYTVREYPFSSCHLADLDLSVDFSAMTGEDSCVSVIATAPLTDDEEWRELQRGELLVFDQGKPVSSSADLFRLELIGHGLHSTVLSPPVLEEDMRTYNFEPQQFVMGEGI